MVASFSTPKNPRRIAAGRANSQVRWGPPSHLVWANLTLPQKRLIRALLDMAEAQNEATSRSATVASEGGHGSDRPSI